MSNTKISIIIPAFNEEKFISDTIVALKKNAFDPAHLQLIVSDGGSTDGTMLKAKQAGATIIKASKARRSIQMNEGAAAATGPILYFLHADTVPPRHFDQIITEHVEAGQHAGCFQLSFDFDHPLLRFYGWCTRFNIDAFRFGDQSLFITKKFFEKTGGFRGDHILLEDQEMVKRIKKHHSFAILPEKVVTSSRKYRRNGTLRLQAIYTLIVMLYKAGISQQKLFTFYKKWVH